LNGGKDGDGKHSEQSAVLALKEVTDKWRAQKSFDPLTDAENKKAIEWHYPVYAVGYNWLDDNKNAATRLQERINQIIKDNNRGMGKCEQVIVVTHSMGGLVARACSKLAGMEAKIVGVVHGVMPANGAAVAYRRCKVGMWDESELSVIGRLGARTIGQSGQEITAVFAQAPGALQLLPNSQYPSNWLEIRDSDGVLLPDQPSTVDPYESIYKERNKWWGLVKEEWLKPEGGKEWTWEQFEKAIELAKKFHAANIKDYYHPNTYGFYGTGVKSFERVTWRMEAGNAKKLGATEAAPTPAKVMGLKYDQMRMDGTNPESVKGPDVSAANYDATGMVQGTTWMTSDHYILRLATATDSGDGTVPQASGRAPLDSSQQMFAIAGLEHEPAYKGVQSQDITLYAINKISQRAKVMA
jgi:PGAP1-like protein